MLIPAGCAELAVTEPPPYANLAFSLSFSSFKSLINLSVGLSLTTALFLIYFALSAYRKVLTVSSKYFAPGLIAHIIYVFELPPRAFYKSLVRLEFLNGTTIPFFPF